MGAVVMAISFVIIGALCLAAGLLWHMAGLFLVGIACFAIAAITGSRGSIPGSTTAH